MLLVNKDIVKQTIDKYGNVIESIVCMEELAELTKAVSKALRGQIDKHNLTEEMADVLICIEILKQIYKVDDNTLKMMVLSKERRNAERLK